MNYNKDMKNAVYLDHAAATPMDDKVLAAMAPFYQTKFHNPSSVYLASRAVKDDLTQARADVAHWLGARPSEITFTAGATEANNIAIRGLMSEKSHLACSAIEHDAVLKPAAKYEHSIVRVDSKGLVSADDLRAAIKPNTVLVSVIYANNEIGTVQHLAELAKVILETRQQRKADHNQAPIYLHTDASQAPNYLDLHVDKLGVDLMTINAGKIYGPKHVGALYVRAGIELTPLQLGGGQEHGLRSGTENVAGAVGLATALALVQKSRKDEIIRLQELTTKLQTGLAAGVEGIEFLGHRKHRLPNLVSILCPGVDGERVVMMLDEAGIQVATGSACSAMSDDVSHVIKAIGRSDAEAASTLRISMGRGTSEDDISYLIEQLPEVIKQARDIATKHN